MSYPKEFTNIYFKREPNKRVLDLVFYNKGNKNALMFDGFFFSYNLNAVVDENIFTELDYSLNNKEGNFIISAIRHDYDIFFILFENGDYFQLYYMMSDEELPQRLGICKSDIQSYNRILNVDIYEDAEVPQDYSENINDWFKRRGKRSTD